MNPFRIFPSFFFMARVLAPPVLSAFLLFALPVFSDFCQGAEIRSVGGDAPAIELKGEIVPGDAARLKKMLKKLGAGTGAAGEVIFDSPGGNFMEGIYIGMDIFENGWATRVNADGICLSACAIAFLGGRYKIKDSGWLPDRNLEAGALLGFHSFYVEDSVQGPVARSVDAGKNIANIFYAYANMLNIRPDVLVRLLDMEPESVLVAITPELLRDLSVNVTGLGSSLSALTKQGAINASLCLVAGAAPVLLDESENNWRLKPEATLLSKKEFRREILERLLAQSPRGGRIAGIIAAALADEPLLRSVYGEISRLGLAPELAGAERIFRVNGLAHANPFMNRVAYFISRKEGQPEFGVDYLLCPTAEAGGRCEEGSLKKYGDIIYELRPAELPLWDMKKSGKR